MKADNCPVRAGGRASTPGKRSERSSTQPHINKLMDELATVALADYDARVRFETRSARGNPKRALTLLDRLDRAGIGAVPPHEHRPTENENPHRSARTRAGRPASPASDTLPNSPASARRTS